MLMKMNKNRPASLILRVTLMVGLATTLSLVALGLFVQRSIELHFVEQETEELGVIAESVQQSLTAAAPSKKGVELAGELEGAVAGHHGVYFLVADDLANLIYATPGPDLMSIAKSVTRVDSIESDSLYNWIENDEHYSGAVLDIAVSNSNLSPETSAEFTVVVAASMDEHLGFLSNFNRTLWSTIIGISLFAVLAAWIAARQAHAPLHDLSAKISSISSDRLDERLDESSVPAELIELVSSFNKMIVRIEEVFAKLSNFSADLAHEFRTPITNIITQTQVSLSKARDVNEYEEILYSNLEEYERMAKLVSDMLFLAKTDNGLIKPTFDPLNLRNEIKELFEFFEAWAEEKSVELVLTGNCPDALGDKSMFKRALSNLISNAIDHTEQNRPVTVRLDYVDSKIVVDVENYGKEITADQLPRIFDRFYQADPSRHGEGAGLGLAIVKSIIEVHNGDITATSDNKMTRFRIRIPSPR